LGGAETMRESTCRRWRWGRCFEVPLGELDHGDARHLVGVEGTEISTLSFAGVEKDFLCRREREPKQGQVGERPEGSFGLVLLRQMTLKRIICSDEIY
jgi:hypothetical protein